MRQSEVETLHPGLTTEIRKFPHAERQRKKIEDNITLGQREEKHSLRWSYIHTMKFHQETDEKPQYPSGAIYLLIYKRNPCVCVRVCVTA